MDSATLMNFLTGLPCSTSTAVSRHAFDIDGGSGTPVKTRLRSLARRRKPFRTLAKPYLGWVLLASSNANAAPSAISPPPAQTPSICGLAAMIAAIFDLLVATDHCAYSDATILMSGYFLNASSPAFFHVSAASTPAMPLN